MARAYPYDDSTDALFRPAAGRTANDFFEGWGDDDRAEPHLLCAEMSRLAYANRPVVEEALPRAGFRFVDWLGGASRVEQFAAWGADGFVAADGAGRTVVAFRGTESDRIEDLIVDLLARPRAWPDGGQVHEGFALGLSRVQGALDAALAAAGGELLVTRHSLGAALATLVAAQRRGRRPRLITFGSPRVGDARFTSLVDPGSVARFVNCCDVVARVPPEAFDEAHVEALLSELTGDQGPSRRVAIVLSRLLALGGVTAEFRHVGPPCYLDRAGRLAPAMNGNAAMSGSEPMSDEAMARDREAARQRHRERHPMPTVHWEDVRAAVIGLIRSIAAGRSLRQAVDEQRGRISFLALAGRVPLLDLADHAPVNYVSAMVCAFRPPPGGPCPARP
jgi:hypothetical protein